MRGSVPQSHTSTAQWQSFELRMRQRRVDRCVQRAREALAAARIRDAEVAIEEAQALDPENPAAAALAARVPIVAARARARRALRQRLAGVAAVVLLAAGLGWILIGAPAAPPAAEGLVASSAAVPTLPEPPAEVAAAHADALPTTDLPGMDAPPPGLDVEPGPLDSEPGPLDSVAGGPPEPARPAAPPAPQGRTEPPAARASDAPSHPAGTAGVRRQEPPAPAARGGAASSDAHQAAPAPAVSRTPVPAPPPAATSEAPPTAPSQPEPSNAPAVVPELPAVALDLSNAAVRAEPLPAISTPPPAAAREAPAPAVNHERHVRAVLNRYQAAYNDLDAAAAGGVWPTVDTRALARAFDGLTSQSVSLGQCNVEIRGAAATADCRGQARWTPRVGGGTQSASRRWRFELAQKGDDWVIMQATVR
jgi:hypothetical protein